VFFYIRRKFSTMRILNAKYLYFKSKNSNDSLDGPDFSIIYYEKFTFYATISEIYDFTRSDKWAFIVSMLY